MGFPAKYSYMINLMIEKRKPRPYELTAIVRGLSSDLVQNQR